MKSLDEPTVIARKVAETPWAFYCAIGYAERYGAPRTMEEALGCPLAIPAGQAEEVFRELRPDANVGYSTNSTAALVDAIAGSGFVGPLPRSVGDLRNDLQLCCPVEYPTPSLWIVYPERLRGRRTSARSSITCPNTSLLGRGISETPRAIELAKRHSAPQRTPGSRLQEPASNSAIMRADTSA